MNTIVVFLDGRRGKNGKEKKCLIFGIGSLKSFCFLSLIFKRFPRKLIPLIFTVSFVFLPCTDLRPRSSFRIGHSDAA